MNMDNAIKYANLSKIASNMSDNTVERITIKNSTMIVVYEKNTIIFGFAGSNDKEDWVHNFRFRQVDFIANQTCYGKVHVGFLNHYNNLKKTIQEKIEDFMAIQETDNDKDTSLSKQIVFCGHSLGATACALASLNFSYKYKNISVYMYGSPKVGNKTFMSNFKEEIPLKFNYIRNEDFVTIMPPFFNYTHLPIKTYLNPDKKRCSFSKRMVEYIFKRRSLMKEHNLDYYIDDLKNY